MTTAAAQDFSKFQAGRQLALGVCASCHVVSADQAAPPKMKPPAPSFRQIAIRPGVTVKSIRHFLLTTHKTLRTPPEMPSLLLTDEEASAAAEYIVSLRNRP